MNNVLLLSLPLDVLKHHVLPYLQPADLVVLANASVALRIFISKQSLPAKKIIYQSAFKHGNVASLSWFWTALKYPKFENDFLIQTSGLVAAAEGILSLLRARDSYLLYFSWKSASTNIWKRELSQSLF